MFISSLPCLRFSNFQADLIQELLAKMAPFTRSSAAACIVALQTQN
jgi:hypothetical protein